MEIKNFDRLKRPFYVCAKDLDFSCRFLTKDKSKNLGCNHPERINEFLFGEDWQERPDGPIFNSRGELLLTCKGCEYKKTDPKDSIIMRKLLKLKLGIKYM